MALKLYFHPLSSFCWKVLIALYENETRFEPHIVDLAKEAERLALKKLWPVGKFPVLHDDAKGRTIAESSIIIEYLAQHHPGKTKLVPADADLVLQTRLWDRIYDFHIHEPMQKIVGDRIRPAGKKDPLGVEQAHEAIETAYGMVDREMATKTWATGDAFTLADCAAAPALYYANRVRSFEAHKNVAAYLARLMARPSFARVFDEAQPYLHLFPG